jgi:predicted nucleotidyltransferase component of viral defense system
MIDRSESLAVATDLGLAPDVVEKDYVLGWLLAGIYAHERLATSWIFKGGTCLKKCYFETYRFSEDLDFTLLEPSHLDEPFLRRAFVDIAAWVYDETGIEIPEDRLRFEVVQNPRTGLSCEGRVYYHGPIRRAGSIPRVKIDLTAEEVVVLPTATRPVTHSYSDMPATAFVAQCYAYEELFAEKLRALAERTRPRDLYDVVNLVRNSEFKAAVGVVLDVLRRKCAFRQIAVPTLSSLAPARAEIEADWQAMLGHQLPALPPFESYWSALSDVFTWLAGRVAPAPTPLPPTPGETRLGPPVGYFRSQGLSGSSFLETIRFAGANRLCVDLDYVNEQGQRAARLVEPYSLRQTAGGDVVLHAVRADSGQARSYRLDRNRGVRVTDRLFLPRYAVDLTVTQSPAVAVGVQRPVSLPSVRLSGPYPRPPRKQTAHATSPVYIYQCSCCGKNFRHTRPASTLSQHKNAQGWPCPARTGFLVDTKW